MLGTLSIASLAGGAAISYYADRLTMAKRSTMTKENAELLAGLLLVLGLVAIGAGVSPLVR